MVRFGFGELEEYYYIYLGQLYNVQARMEISNMDLEYNTLGEPEREWCGPGCTLAPPASVSASSNPNFIHAISWQFSLFPTLRPRQHNPTGNLSLCVLSSFLSLLTHPRYLCQATYQSRRSDLVKFWSTSTALASISSM